jgi:hypothetical protein
VSGWEQPTPRPPGESSPRNYWTQSVEADPLGAGQLIRGAWRLYRSAPRRFVVVAAIPAVIQALVTLPSMAAIVEVGQRVFDVMATYIGRIAANPEAAGAADQQAFQAELQAQLQAMMIPQADFAPVTAIGAGIAVAVGLIGAAAITAVALSVAAGRPIPMTFAFRLVAARAGLLKPIAALGVGWVAVTWLPLVLQASPTFQAWVGAAGSPRSNLIGSLLSVLALVVVVGIVVFAVRWALYIPAVLVEALGMGPALARAARLTHGIRIRLGLAMAGLLVLEALVVGTAATAIGFAVGLSASSARAGFVTYLAVGLIGNVIWAPLLPATLALAYRARTRDAEAARTVDA